MDLYKKEINEKVIEFVRNHNDSDMWDINTQRKGSRIMNKKTIEELEKEIKELAWALSIMITISENPIDPPNHICGSPDAQCDMLCEEYARQEDLRNDCRRIQRKYQNMYSIDQARNKDKRILQRNS